MNKKTILSIYTVNLMLEAIFDLAFPIGVGVLVSWYFVTKRGVCGEWLYAVLILLGTFIGFYSMIKFIIKATAQIRAIEAQQNEKGKRQ